MQTVQGLLERPCVCWFPATSCVPSAYWSLGVRCAQMATGVTGCCCAPSLDVTMHDFRPCSLIPAHTFVNRLHGIFVQKRICTSTTNMCTMP